MSRRLPEHGSIVSRVAFGKESLLRSLWEPLDEGREEPDPFPNETVDDLIERGGQAGSAVALGLAHGATAIGGALAHHLRRALDVTPANVQHVLSEAIGRIAKLVVKLVHRAQQIVSAVVGNQRAVVEGITGAADPASWVSESVFGKALGKFLETDDVRKRASAEFSARSDQERVGARLGKLVKSHRKWVGPVRVVAGGIGALWAVPLGPVPAAPVAAVILLAWTVVLTGDMLDARHYPDLWKGVVRISAGER